MVTTSAALPLFHSFASQCMFVPGAVCTVYRLNEWWWEAYSNETLQECNAVRPFTMSTLINPPAILPALQTTLNVVFLWWALWRISRLVNDQCTRVFFLRGTGKLKLNIYFKVVHSFLLARRTEMFPIIASEEKNGQPPLILEFWWNLQ